MSTPPPPPNMHANSKGNLFGTKRMWFFMIVGAVVFAACTSGGSKKSDYVAPYSGPVAVTDAQFTTIREVCTDAAGTYMANKFKVINGTITYDEHPMTRAKRYNKATGFIANVTLQFGGRSMEMTCMLDEDFKMPSFGRR